MSLNDVCTASPDSSIWLGLSEETFRQHLVELEERTNAIPIDRQIFSTRDRTQVSSNEAESSHTLPINIEQQLADDFAWLVAVADGAQSIAAVCIEEHVQPPGLTLRLAARDVYFNDAVKTTLQAIFDVLACAAASSSLVEGNTSEHVAMLFRHVVQLHFDRLLARLRSSKWVKPKYLSRSVKKPLWKDFANLIHRTEFAYTKVEKSTRKIVMKQLEELSLLYEQFEKSEDELSSLMHLVEATFSFCSTEEIKDYSRRLNVNTRPTPQIQAAIKSLRQLEKVGAYRRICMSLVNTAKQYPTLFQHMTMTHLTPYKSVPTSIRFQKWATSCHVHAEVQLAVYYDLSPHYQPRCIGSSKWLCYLCYLFLRAHNRFFVSKTHGHLYDQWTVPDLMEFDKGLSQRYRNILKAVDDIILQQIQSEGELGRLEPMTSCASGQTDCY